MRRSRRELDAHLNQVLSDQVSITISKPQMVKPQDDDNTQHTTPYTVNVTYTNNIGSLDMDLMPEHLQDIIYRYLVNGFRIRGSLEELGQINFLALAIDFAGFNGWTIKGYAFAK